ncbi:ATP-binding cassette domain-containing protein [Enterococcus timonensis]|uniref:ATP-binding cassette domain-containing protein n=1 Tax=Enterococcus timonensis TaxID=1852364 RepID=UPI0008D9F342|nr:ATP-binding cassette domain-containing protein [Enterococcus timonensis]
MVGLSASAVLNSTVFCSSFKKGLVLNGVSYTYNQTKIQFPQMTFEKGKKYAIIGESGSGKSTLLNILTGRFPDYQGEILVNGQDFQEVAQASWFENISYVSQTPITFKKSALFNITLQRDYSKEKLELAMDTAQVTPFIHQLPQELDTIIDASKNNLSGGQIQRVTIARELLGQKPILILDEATSALDYQNAIAVEKNILENPDLTVICVTHSLHEETKGYFDQIYQLS